MTAALSPFSERVVVIRSKTLGSLALGLLLLSVNRGSSSMGNAPQLNVAEKNVRIRRVHLKGTDWAVTMLQFCLPLLLARLPTV